jgi:hypothetical protein
MVGAAHADGVPPPPGSVPCRQGSAVMAKVELYFGAGRATAAASSRKWARFLADTVTPRFPDGLTSWAADGQWRGPHGLAKEPAYVLVIFYRPDATSDARIDAIRATYARRFRQTSVLRADSSACVGF